MGSLTFNYFLMGSSPKWSSLWIISGIHLYLYMYNLACDSFIWYLLFIVTDVLWITATLFAAVYSSLDEGDTPKFQLISVPVGQIFCLSRLQVMISWQHSCPQRLWSVCWAPRITTTEPVICKSLWFTDYPLNLRNLIGWEFKASTESCACSVNQIRPEVMILGADQKECMLWGQECSDSGDDCFFYRQVVKRSILPLVWFIIPYQIMSTVKLNHNWHLITTLSIVVFDWVL